MPAEASKRPEQRLYLQLSGQDLTVIHVRNEGKTGHYFTVPVQGQGEEEQRLSALLTALGSVPFHSLVYVHTNLHTLREQLRRPPSGWPKELKALLQRKSLQLRVGTLTRLDGFWQDILTQAEGGTLPRMNGLNHYHLHTYAVTDGLQTHVAGLLYGEGELHLYDGRVRGEQLCQTELEAACWALDLVTPSKTIELRHQHPTTRRFWEDAERYLSDSPDVQPLARRIGRLIEEKNLRFNVPQTRLDDTLARAVRWYTGRGLA